MSIFLVATIFKSSGVDYRLIALGAMLPLLVDIPFGYRAYGYTLLFAVVLLVGIMIGTIGRPRLLRRRLLCLPIGVFCGLVLSGAFLNDELFWWPSSGPRSRTSRCCPRRGSSSSRSSWGSRCAGSSWVSTTSTCRGRAVRSCA